MVESNNKITEIGGFFSLELNNSGGFLHNDGILVNSCRNALQLVLQALKAKMLWIPYYTCRTIIIPLERLGVSYKFYHINDSLEIAEYPFGDNDYILYTNYFGLKDKYIEKLAKEFGGRLIVDNAQSYFSNPLKGVSTVYSTRKFFGVPDGGVAFTTSKETIKLKQDVSYERCKHLLRRVDEGAKAAYFDFKTSEEFFVSAEPKQMSKLTDTILKSIDFDFVKTRRISNYNIMHSALHKLNKLSVKLNINSCPMVYPFLVENGKELRKKLIQENIFIATYWPNVFEWCKPTDFEYMLAENCLPLPVDQRYGKKEMRIIIEKIK